MFAESVSTLKFASRAKRICNRVSVNEDPDQRTLLRKYERELKKLRSELQQRQVDLVDKRQLLAVSIFTPPPPHHTSLHLSHAPPLCI